MALNYSLYKLYRYARTLAQSNLWSIWHETILRTSYFSTISSHSENTNQFSSSLPVVKVCVFDANEKHKNHLMAIFWDESSKMNCLKELQQESRTTAEIDAVNLALKQAICKLRLVQVRVCTDSKFVCQHFAKTSILWDLDEFMLRKGTLMKYCKEEAQDLYRLLHMIDAYIEYDSSVVSQLEQTFDLVNYKSDKMVPEEVIHGNGEVGANSSLASSSKSGRIPVIYTCAVLHRNESANESPSISAAYGIYWLDDYEMGDGRRYTYFPLTLVRCQLQAVIDALQQAIDKGYTNVIVRTDCLTFIVHHSRKWLKSNGSYVRYHDQYLRIMNLSQKIKVRFQLAKSDSALKQAELLAENAICLPAHSRRFMNRPLISESLRKIQI